MGHYDESEGIGAGGLLQPCRVQYNAKNFVHAADIHWPTLGSTESVAHGIAARTATRLGDISRWALAVS